MRLLKRLGHPNLLLRKPLYIEAASNINEAASYNNKRAPSILLMLYVIAIALYNMEAASFTTDAIS